MRTRTKVAVVVLSILLAVSGVGCVALSKMVTPAEIDAGAVAYAVDGGAAEPNDYVGYPSLAKAEALAQDVDASHKGIQLRLRQAIERDNLSYSTHKNVVAIAVEKARQLESTLFGPTGLLSMGLTALGVGGLGGFVGLMRRKPGDWSPEDVDKAMAQAGLEGKIKGEQIMEIIKGIEKFKNASGANWGQLSAFLSSEMSAGTKEAVAVAKANL